MREFRFELQVSAAIDIVGVEISEEEGSKGTLKGVVSRDLAAPNARTASENLSFQSHNNIRAVRGDE